MKLTLLGRLHLFSGLSVSAATWRLVDNQRLGKRTRLLKCCGPVYQIESLYTYEDVLGVWRGMNDYICMCCHKRAKIKL